MIVAFLIIDEDGDFHVVSVLDGERTEKNVLYGSWLPNDGERHIYRLDSITDPAMLEGIV